MSDRYDQRPARARVADIMPIGRDEIRPMFAGGRGSVGSSAPSLPANDQLIRLIDTRGDDELGGVVSVALGVDVPDAFTSGDILRIRGRIKWGSGGVTQSADIDVRRGTIISVPCSAIEVSVANEGTQITPTVWAQAAHMPRGGGGNATRTRYRDTSIGNGNSWDSVVPPFARLVSVMRNPQSAPMILRFLDSDGTVAYEENVAASGTAFRIPLSGDIATLRLVAGAAITLARAVFDLDL